MAEDGIARRAAARDPVSITDLVLAGQPAADDTGQTFVTELLRREGRVDDPAPPARPSRVCWLVAVLACLALVLGAGTASMAALSGPRTERTAPTSPVPASIVGAEALRPDLISASVQFPPTSAPATSAAAEAVPAPTPASTEATPAASDRTRPQQPTGRALPDPADRSAPDPGQPQPPAAPDARAGSSEHNAVLGTVATFYQDVAVTPLQAFNLLDPQMRGSGYQDFRNGWADVERVTVENMRLDSPHSVLVTVSLTRSDGTVLRTLQRVLVTPGAEPRITDARLLSASRS